MKQKQYLEETTAAVTTASIGPDALAPKKLTGAKYSVFDVSDDIFSRFVNPRRKYKKWSDYIEESNENFQAIKQAVQKGNVVVLRNSRGAALTIRNNKYLG
jgi:hypothetical protein